LGVLTIVVAVANAGIGLINGTPVDWAATTAAVTAGVGLITAKDASVKG